MRLVAIGGIGRKFARRAAEVAVEQAQPKELMSAGIAGAVSPKLKVGDGRSAFVGGRGATGDSLSDDRRRMDAGTVDEVSDGAEKQACCGSMRLMRSTWKRPRSAQVAQEHGLKFAALKAISDDAAFAMPPFQRFINAQGRFDTGRFVAWLCVASEPWWAAVGKMRRNSKLASANLCRALEHLIEGGRWRIEVADLAFSRTDSRAETEPMSSATQLGSATQPQAIPATMQAAVYYGVDDVRLETVPVPKIGAGEILVRVHTCGICGTDLKKIATGSHSAPRIFGHEIGGVIAQVGEGVSDYRVGDRVMVFHHIPCGDCYYCRHKVFAQCPTYKKVGATAGYEASGGGFAEYVRVMDWIVAKGGVVRIPDGVSFEQASFIEPVNTCMKGIETLRLSPGETVLVMGQGPIGIILAVLARRRGARVITSDLLSQRHTIAKAFGLNENIDASTSDTVLRAKELTEGRGADAVILAVAGNSLIRAAMEATRPGGRVLLFAQTQHGEATIDPAVVCVDEKSLLGSYSASVDLQEESARFVLEPGNGSGAADQSSISLGRIDRGFAVGGPSQAGFDESCDSTGQRMEGRVE